MSEDTRIMTDAEMAAAERRIAEEVAAARARPADPETERRVAEALERPYPLRVWREPEGYWVAEAPDVEGCLGTGADAAAAIADWRAAFAAWAESALADGAPLPEPSPAPTPERHSGRFVLRLPRSLHRRLAEQAEREGVSLNQLALTYVATGLGGAAASPERRPEEPAGVDARGRLLERPGWPNRAP